MTDSPHVVTVNPPPSSTATPRPSSVTTPPVSQPAMVPALAVAPDAIDDLRAPGLYLNREISWLAFNARVLAEAENEAVPLLERLKFHAIVSSNLDEFFMVRVAGLKQQLTGEVGEMPPDGMTITEQLTAISQRVHELVDRQSNNLTLNLLPKLLEQGIRLVKVESLPPDAQAALDQRFNNEIFPILTPIAIDPGHPFPHLRNKSLNLGVMFQREGAVEAGFGVVQVPDDAAAPVRGARREGGRRAPARHTFVLLEDLIARNVATIFPAVRLRGVYAFRVTRNFDLEIDEEEGEDLLQTIQQELRRRERGNAVRLEVAGEPTAGVARQAREGAQARSRARRLPHLGRAQRLRPDADRRARGPARSARRAVRAARVPPLRDADDIFADHPRGRRAPASPLRVVRRRGRAHHARGRRPERPRHQADALPRRRRLADRRRRWRARRRPASRSRRSSS